MSAQRWVLALMVGAIGAIAFGATTTGCYETCDPGETRSCSCGTTAGLETCQPGEYWGVGNWTQTLHMLAVAPLCM